MNYRMAVRQLDVAIRELADKVRQDELEPEEAQERLEMAAKLLDTGKTPSLINK